MISAQRERELGSLLYSFQCKIEENHSVTFQARIEKTHIFTCCNMQYNKKFKKFLQQLFVCLFVYRPSLEFF